MRNYFPLYIKSDFFRATFHFYQKNFILYHVIISHLIHDVNNKLTARDEHLRGSYFSYDSCMVVPTDDNTDTSDQFLRLAADVLIDILENMERHSE